MKLKIENGLVGKIAGAVLALSPMVFLWADTLQTDEDNLSHYARLPRSFKLNADVFYATNQVLIRCFLLWPESMRRRLYERGAAWTTQHIVRITSLSTKYSGIPHSLKNFYLLKNGLKRVDF
jgi:hypothetical protein